MQDSEMHLLDQMFRAELIRFKNADEATRREVVRLIVEAGGFDWLVELTQDDEDPQVRAYGELAKKHRGGE